MSRDLVPVRRWRKEIPQEHRASLDTRLLWLWHQRFGTVQTIYNESPDILDKTAATLILQAILARDLNSIQQLLERIEGGSRFDDEIIDDEAVRI
jgi:tRNA(Met) C34 N-acetyltransferase TmcA